MSFNEQTYNDIFERKNEDSLGEPAQKIKIQRRFIRNQRRDPETQEEKLANKLFDLLIS